ncbi:uncharacterized protein LODBEIA_P06360 [Lodderomyces beijingensis]|uniref:Uncharacterized protein n=1 Tax=Lodderomyces beijingensis TaxID=1775926 RepID=A0ABP0ZG54_9ASCO
MQFFTTLLVAVYCLVLQVAAAPTEKRYFSPSSPVFSLIAIHKGEKFHANLVKFNGTAIKLGSDDKALFGTIEASNGYILNLPFTNSSNQTSEVSVAVSNRTLLLSTTSEKTSASEHFGINNGWLTFQNTTSFLACPEIVATNLTRNGTASNVTADYDLFYNPLNKTKCANNLTGYDVQLSVQVSTPFSFSPETNAGGWFKRDHLVKRVVKLFT